MKLSIIIPTKNRRIVLEKCLNAIFAQDIDKEKFEVIVVDDGTVDETADFMKHYMATSKENNIFYYFQQNKGAALARNLGFEKSKGELVLFNDDDNIQQEGCLSEHVKVHTLFPNNNIAVCGNFITEKKASVCQYNSDYGKIAYIDAQNNIWRAHWMRLWTKNVSFKRTFFKEFGIFDLALKQYEDIELGYRLSKHGLLLLMAGNAINIDECPITDTKLFITEKAKRYGESFFVWHRKAPGLLEDLERENCLEEFLFCLSKKSRLIKKIKFFLSRILVNGLTVNFWIFIVDFLEKRWKVFARIISWAIYRYNYRRAYYAKVKDKNL